MISTSKIGVSASRGSGGGAATGLVTDGLILNLDSTDTNSYSGSGTVWTDLSGEGNHFDLINGPTFSTDDGGTIVTDGTNDYIKSQGNIDEVNSANSTFVYVKCVNLDAHNYQNNHFTWLISKGFNNSAFNSLSVLFAVTTTQWSTYGYASFRIQLENASYTRVIDWKGWDESTVPQISEGNWYYLGYTTSGGSGDDIDVFLNGVKVATATLSGERTPSSNQPMVLASDSWSRANGMPGSNRNYHMYSRKLTDAEVLQNYNAIKI